MPSYPLAFPSLLPARVVARLARAQARSQSPFSYAQQVYDHGGRAWLIDVEMQPMDSTDAATVGLFLHDLDGLTGTFTFDLTPWTPGASPAVGSKTFRLVSTDPPWDSSFGNVFTFRLTAQEVV